VKKTLMTLAMIGVSTSAVAETVQDFNKTVINRVPNNVEVCTKQTASGDRSGDMLKGAIIGGILGNNVGDIKNGGAAGAIIGGMIGHNNSTATGGTKTVCQLETRYDEEQVSVYSHSVIKFEYNNRVYTTTFKK